MTEIFKYCFNIKLEVAIILNQCKVFKLIAQSFEKNLYE